MKKQISKALQLIELRRVVKNARRNAARQRVRLILAQGNNKYVRVRPEFWDQVERNAKNQIRELQK